MLIQDEIKLYGQKSNINCLWCISSLFSIHILFSFFLFQKYEISEKCLRNMHPYKQMMWQIWFWNDRHTMKLNYAGIPLGPSRGVKGRQNTNARQKSGLTIIWQARAEWIWDRSIFFSIFRKEYDSLFYYFYYQKRLKKVKKNNFTFTNLTKCVNQHGCALEILKKILIFHIFFAVCNMSL